MPIQLEIFHPDRLVVAVARGAVTIEDYGGLLAGIVQAGVTHYRKIIDSTEAESDDVTLELLLQADELTRKLDGPPRGPLALVVNRAKGGIARAFGEQSTDRPVGVFGSLHEARAWLRTLPIVE